MCISDGGVSYPVCVGGGMHPTYQQHAMHLCGGELLWRLLCARRPIHWFTANCVLLLSLRLVQGQPQAPRLTEDPAAGGLPPTDGNTDMCMVCGCGGSLLCCDGCPAAYHLRCISASSRTLPDAEWLCPECAIGGRGEDGRGLGASWSGRGGGWQVRGGSRALRNTGHLCLPQQAACLCEVHQVVVLCQRVYVGVTITLTLHTGREQQGCSWHVWPWYTCYCKHGAPCGSRCATKFMLLVPPLLLLLELSVQPVVTVAVAAWTCRRGSRYPRPSRWHPAWRGGADLDRIWPPVQGPATPRSCLGQPAAAPVADGAAAAR